MSAVERPIVDDRDEEGVLAADENRRRGRRRAAPSGRTPKPAPNVARLAEEARVAVGLREEQVAEEDGERAVEIEVVPLEERAQARREDDRAQALPVRGLHAGRTVGLEGGARQAGALTAPHAVRARWAC